LSPPTPPSRPPHWFGTSFAQKAAYAAPHDEAFELAPHPRGPPGSGWQFRGPDRPARFVSFGVNVAPSSVDLPRVNPLERSEHAQSSGPRVARQWMARVAFFREKARSVLFALQRPAVVPT